MFRPCVLILVHNHDQVVCEVTRQVLAQNLPCMLVDDGSSPDCARLLDIIANEEPKRVILLRHEVSQGKGRAVVTGMYHALRCGYSHVLQIDADARHSVDDIPRFLEQALAMPSALVVGYSYYGDSASRFRMIGDFLRNCWVWINTLSTHIKDAACGLRVYPVIPVLQFIQRRKLGAHAHFDVELLVRMFWDDAVIVNVPAQVGDSNKRMAHFRTWSDMARVPILHVRLFFGMLRRMPKIILSKRSRGELASAGVKVRLLSTDL